MNKIYEIFDRIVADEGGYVNHANDPGGETNFGITEAVAKRHGINDVKGITRQQAIDIYTQDYFLKPNFDAFTGYSLSFGEVVINAGVNVGTSRATKWVQECLNKFNKRGAYYPDLVVDGQLGRKTRDALRAFYEKRGDEGIQVLKIAFQCKQGNHYLSLGEWSEDFTYGWLKNRVVL